MSIILKQNSSTNEAESLLEKLCTMNYNLEYFWSLKHFHFHLLKNDKVEKILAIDFSIYLLYNKMLCYNMKNNTESLSPCFHRKFLSCNTYLILRDSLCILSPCMCSVATLIGKVYRAQRVR